METSEKSLVKILRSCLASSNTREGDGSLGKKWHLIGTIGAGCIWLAVSLLVAFPNEAMRADFTNLSINFTTGWNRLFLPLLLLADIFIALAVLKDEALHRRISARSSFIVLVAAGFVYLVALVALPHFNPDGLAWPKSLLLIGCLCLLAVRSVSYVRAETFVPLKP